MKLKQLMLAPVALGMVTPTAIAADLNMKQSTNTLQNRSQASLNSLMCNLPIGHIKHSAAS
jgi:hypothetical protein